MRQRVGFARALVVEPDALLMDEPFSALDVLTAQNLRTELLRLWAQQDFPTKAMLIVTHNIEEAVILADRIFVLGSNPGRIRTEIPVPLPQPRDRHDPAFQGLVDEIYGFMTGGTEGAVARVDGRRSPGRARRSSRRCPQRPWAGCPACSRSSRHAAGATTSQPSPTSSPSRSTTCCRWSTRPSCSGWPW